MKYYTTRVELDRGDRLYNLDASGPEESVPRASHTDWTSFWGAAHILKRPSTYLTLAKNWIVL